MPELLCNLCNLSFLFPGIRHVECWGCHLHATYIIFIQIRTAVHYHHLKPKLFDPRYLPDCNFDFLPAVESVFKGRI
jgi:hypothetical protein